MWKHLQFTMDILFYSCIFPFQQRENFVRLIFNIKRTLKEETFFFKFLIILYFVLLYLNLHYQVWGMKSTTEVHPHPYFCIYYICCPNHYFSLSVLFRFSSHLTIMSSSTSDYFLWIYFYISLQVRHSFYLFNVIKKWYFYMLNKHDI